MDVSKKSPLLSVKGFVLIVFNKFFKIVTTLNITIETNQS